MKRIILSALWVAQSAMASPSLSDFQWKNRLLVIPRGDAELVRQMGEEAEGLAERDLRVFILDGAGAKKHPAKTKLAVELSKRLSPDAKKPEVILIGKDGRTTIRWERKDFTFKKLYARIDAMPMRQREMRVGK